MITRIEALNYRCLRFVQQDLGPFQILVGPNASGKSTFLDVPALMRDIVRDGRQDIEAAISSRAATYTDLFWSGTGRCFELAIEALIPEERRSHLPADHTRAYYWLRTGEIGPSSELGISREVLSVGPPVATVARPRHQFPAVLEPPSALPTQERQNSSRVIVEKLFSDGKDYFWPETDPQKLLASMFRLGHRRSALANLPEDEEMFPVATWFRQFLINDVEVLALNSRAMRRASPPNVAKRLVADGSNLPWLVHQLESESHRSDLEEWVSHLRTALPDLRGIRTVEREEDRHRYIKLLYDGGVEVPQWLVSDGTLDILALTLLAYLPDTTGVYLVEEPENGIHPIAIEAVLLSLTSVYDGQVLLATHSPVILSVADVDHVLCFARSAQGTVDTVPGKDHPNLRHWRGETNLGMLFAGGVLG